MINDVKHERFGDAPLKMSAEIPYLLAYQAIIEHDRKIARRAKRREKIKSFFQKVRTRLWPA